MLTTSKQFRRLGILALLLTGFFVTLFRPPLVYAGGVVGNGTSASCTETAFNVALADGGLITFNCGGAKTITFTFYKSIDTDTTIDGGGVITLSGGNAVSLFQVFDSRQLTLQNITLANGKSGSLTAGAIENFGTTIISNSILRDNVSTTTGGAIVNYGTLNLNNATVLKNKATLGGGGIYNDGGVVNITNSQILENRAIQGDRGGGGGLQNWSGTVNIQNSAFDYNGSLNGAGAIMVNSGMLNIQNSTFSHNSGSSGGAVAVNRDATAFIAAALFDNNSATYGAGISSSGAMVISQTTFSLNRASLTGGGIYGIGETVLNGVTMSGNTAEGDGGGIRIEGSIELTNSTVSGNTAGGRGGGLYITQQELRELTNVTISGNQATAGGGGIYLVAGSTSLNFVSVVSNTASAGGGLYYADGDMSLKNTLLASNGGGNCQGSDLTSLGHNLANDDSCNDVLDQPTDKRGTTITLPLGPLANNGGPTLTHLPLNGNPAINGGVCVDSISTDQRGLPRPVETVCDAGAVEVGSMGGRVVYLPIVVK